MTDPKEQLVKTILQAFESMVINTALQKASLNEEQRGDVQDMIQNYFNDSMPDNIHDMIYEKANEALDDTIEDRISDWIENNLADRLTINFE